MTTKFDIYGPDQIGTLAQNIFQHMMENPAYHERFEEVMNIKNQKAVFCHAFTMGVEAALDAMHKGYLKKVGRG